MSAHDNLSRPQFFHGTSGAHSFEPGDVLDPADIGRKHVYYTSSQETASHYATYGGPDMYNPEPGHVYQVQPETKTGRKLGKHAEDPWSGLSGNHEAYRTGGRLRVIGEVGKVDRPDPNALINRERGLK